MARPTYPSDKQNQFMVRLPDGMRERIKASADAEGRSMNAEIVERLEWSFKHWLDIDLSPELRNRMDFSTDEQLKAFREELHASVADIAWRHFFDGETAIDTISKTLDYFISLADEKEQADLRENTQRALVDIINKLPDTSGNQKETMGAIAVESLRSSGV